MLGQQHLRSADFVDHVNRLVGQLAVIDVFGRQFHRRLDRLGGVADFVVILEIGFDPHQDLDRVRDRGLGHVDFLEAPHQGAILFEILAIFLVGGRADAAQDARRQRRLEQVGSVHRPARGGARADHGMDFVNEEYRALDAFQFLDDGFQPLLEIAAIAGAGDQRTHVEGIDGGAAQHFGHFIVDDLACQAFGNGGLADAGIAHEQRIVLLAAAKNLDGAVHFGGAADQRVDPARLGLFIQVDAIGFQRLGALLVGLLGFFLLVRGAARRLGLAHAGPLGDAMADITHRIQPVHILLMQEIDGVAFALGEKRHQNIGARDLVTAGILHMQHGALHHALEAGGGFGLLAVLDHQGDQFLIDIFLHRAPERVGVDIAGFHHLAGIGIVHQGQQQMFKSRVFMMPVTGKFDGVMQGRFQTPGQ